MTKSEQFKEEFKALLRKYKAEMTVKERDTGYSMIADGVEFWLEGEMIGEEYITYPTVEFGTWENGK